MPPQWVPLDPREVSHHPVPHVGLRLPCTASEPTGHVWWVSRSVVTSTPRGGPWAKSREAAAKAARGADKTGACISHSSCETWHVSVLEPGQSLELIAMALPTLTSVFATTSRSPFQTILFYDQESMEIFTESSLCLRGCLCMYLLRTVSP